MKPEVVVVTGASAGIGRAAALEFARHGASLGLVARGSDRLESTRREVEAVGGKAVLLAADIADPKTAERLAQMTEDAFGLTDVWINNAMASVYSKISDMPEDEFARVTAVTYLGYAAGQPMVSGSGRLGRPRTVRRRCAGLELAGPCLGAIAACCSQASGRWVRWRSGFACCDEAVNPRRQPDNG